MPSNLEQDVLDFPTNHPYIAVVIGNTFQCFITAEYFALCKAKSFSDAIYDLIAAYYLFNIAYPKPIDPILTYIQKLVLNVNDPVKIPTVFVKIAAAIDKM